MLHKGETHQRWMFSAIVGTAVTAVVAAGVMLGGTPAVAAGGTSASALTLALDANLDVGPIAVALVSANSRVGYVTAPSHAGTTRGSVGTLNASGTAVDGQARVGSLTATRTDIGTRSAAQLVGAHVDALSANLVSTSDVEASAMCPVGGTPAVQANVVGLHVLGHAVNASVSPVQVSANASLGVAGVTNARIVATVSSPRSVSGAGASVTAVRVTAKVVADVLGDESTINLGHVDLASAQCSTPAAVKPSASTIDPDHGPTSGGQHVTITGDAFVPGDTSVAFGDHTVPASKVDVNADGTSLTLSTPASVAGPVDVVVHTPGGSDGPLTYTYVGEGASSAGGGTLPSDGTTTGTPGAGGSDGTGGGHGTGASAAGGGTLGGSGSVVPASDTVSSGASTGTGPAGLLASTGPLGLVGMALLGLVLVLGGAMLAKRASARPGLAENPWVDPKE